MTEPPDSSWGGTGLAPLAGRILEHLVSHPESSAAEVASAVRTSPPAAGRALRTLEAELLAVRVSRQPVRWSASPPRPALTSLLARRREELARVEMFAERLHDAYSSASHHRFASDQFEILDTEKRVTARYTHLLRASRHEVLHLVMPPYVAALDAVPHRMSTQAAAIRGGVRFRSVYDSDTFTDDVSLETARQGIAMGGEVRLSSGLPMKLVLFDGTSAIMPLLKDDPTAGSLLVHSPTLLHVLIALFESVWEHGAPWEHDAPPAPHPTFAAARADGPDERTREILRLMELGMKDDAIARVMRLSRRTIQKHIGDAGLALGARTRFQIALLAQERGWLLPAGPAAAAAAPSGAAATVPGDAQRPPAGPTPGRPETAG
jgi:DNA-binding CsgD family transcriptional regulator